MKTKLVPLIAALLAAPAMAAVVQTTGTGSATPSANHVIYAANFEANTSTASSWFEDGLQFNEVIPNTANNGGYQGGDNGGCGYAGAICLNPGDAYSQAFTGNYFATAGYGAYLSIRSTVADMHGIEFAVDSGYLNIFVAWQTYLDGVLTGSGKQAMGTAGIGGVLGLADAAGFDEVRVYTFDSASDNINASNYAMPAIDSVRAFTIPEPGSLALAAIAGLAAAGLRRRRR